MPSIWLYTPRWTPNSKGQSEDTATMSGHMSDRFFFLPVQCTWRRFHFCSKALQQILHCVLQQEVPTRSPTPWGSLFPFALTIRTNHRSKWKTAQRLEHGLACVRFSQPQLIVSLVARTTHVLSGTLRPLKNHQLIFLLRLEWIDAVSQHYLNHMFNPLTWSVMNRLFCMKTQSVVRILGSEVLPRWPFTVKSQSRVKFLLQQWRKKAQRNWVWKL